MKADPTRVPEGPLGSAAAIDCDWVKDRWPAAIVAWVITAPVYHPLWAQYYLSVISLADFEGQPPAVKKSPEMTHELIVLALNPDRGPHTPESMLNNGLSFLTPGNVAQQFVGTDAASAELGWLCTWAVLNGVLNPETADAPTAIRAAWASSIEQTLAHIRGEHGDAS